MAVRKTRARKKAEALKTFIEVIFFVLLFFIGYKAYGYLMEFWIHDLDAGTIKSMEGLKVEMDNMVKDSTTVPLFIDGNHKIVGFTHFERTRECEGNRSCVCICSVDSQCENNALKKCVGLEAKLYSDFIINPKKADDTDHRTFNCILTKKGEKLLVSC
jgi:hypothetical protein